MSFKVYLSVATSIFFLNCVDAKPVRFQSGEIHGVQLTTNKAQIGDADKPTNKSNSNYNDSKDLLKIESSKKAYLVLFVKIDPLRKLSIYDYTIFANGDNYNCISIANGDDKFKSYDPTNNSSKFVFTRNDKYHKMLFVIEKSKNYKRGVENTLSLKYHLTDKVISQKISAKILGSDQLTIPASLSIKVVASKNNTSFRIPKSNAEIASYILGTWFNKDTNNQFKFSSNNRNKKWGWKIVDGKLYRITESLNDLKLIKIVSKSVILIKDSKCVRK